MHYHTSYPLFPFESQLGTACLCLGTTPHGKYAVLFGCFGPGVWISTLKQCTIWVTKNWSLPCWSRCFKNPRFNPTLPCMRPHSMSLPAALEATKIFIFGGCEGKAKHHSFLNSSSSSSWCCCCCCCCCCWWWWWRRQPFCLFHFDVRIVCFEALRS